MLNTLQNRILLILATLSSLVAIGFYLIYKYEGKSVDQAVKSFEKQHLGLLRAVVQSQGSTVQSFTNDFSQWDELLNALRRADNGFIEANMGYAIHKYGIAHLWILDSGLSPVYGKSMTAKEDPMPVLLDKGQLLELLERERFPHFFLKSGPNMLEFFAAPLHPQVDSARAGKPEGWLFAAKQWNDSLLFILSELTSSKLELDTFSIPKQPVMPEATDPSMITVSLVLEGWSGRPVGALKSAAKIHFIEAHQKSYHRFLLITLLLAVGFLVSITILLFRFVELPLRYLNKTLEFRDMQFLEPMRNQHDAFGRLRENIIQLFRKEALLLEVNKRRKLESQLLQSENRYRLLVENIPDVLWICNIEGELVYLSPNSYTVLGYYPEELIGKEEKWRELIHPDDYEPMLLHFNSFIQQNKAYYHEYRFRQNSGKEIWIGEKAISQFEFEGETFKCGRISDITRDKLLKLQLYQSEQQYKSLFVQNPFGVVLIGLGDFSIRELNQAFSEMMEYGPEELIGKKIVEITFEGDIDLEMRASRMAKDQGKDVFSLEKRLVKKSGQEFWVFVTISYIYDQQGHRVMGCGIVEDITQKKKIQDALDYEHNLLLSLMENVPDLIFFKNEEGRYLNANQATRSHMMKMGFGDPLGNTDLELFHDTGFLSEIREDDRVVFETGKSIINKELALTSRSGEKYWFLVSKIPIYSDIDKSTLLVGILKDITVQKKNELRLVQYAEELKETNLSKDKFLSILAHDLKNPFNQILGFSSLLLEEYDDYTEAERKHFVSNIHQATESTFTLIQNILEWTRSQTGRLEFNPVLQDINAIVQETYTLLKPALEKKNVRFVSNIPSRTVAYCDANMIKTVLRNLLSNAVKFSSGGSSITLSCRFLQDAMTEFCIEDQGIGIPEEAMHRLFRIDDSYRREGTMGEQGTGLGLITCKEFVEKNGGMIWATSQADKGSKFIFTLPRERQGIESHNNNQYI